MKQIGTINTVLKGYWWGRRTHYHGLNSDGEDPELDVNKNYGLVKFNDGDGRYVIRNFFEKTLDEKNYYYADDICAYNWFVADEKNVMQKWNEKNNNRPFALYLVEFSSNYEIVLQSIADFEKEKSSIEINVDFLKKIKNNVVAEKQKPGLYGWFLNLIK